MSEQHAHEARQALLQNVARGEARMNLADAALHIAAEDDAIASHAAVALPVASYQQRLARMADELARGLLARLPPDAEPADAVKVQRILALTESLHLPGMLRHDTMPGLQLKQAISERWKSLPLREQVVETFLWEQQHFRLPSFGRSNVPSNTVVDHPGASMSQP